MSDFLYKPLSNFVVLDIEEKTIKNKGKVIVPKTSDKGKYARATVVAVSEEKDVNGNLLVRSVKVGDNVSVGGFAQMNVIYVVDKEYVVCRETDIVGIILEGGEPEFDEEPDVPRGNIITLRESKIVN